MFDRTVRLADMTPIGRMATLSRQMTTVAPRRKRAQWKIIVAVEMAVLVAILLGKL